MNDLQIDGLTEQQAQLFGLLYELIAAKDERIKELQNKITEKDNIIEEIKKQELPSYLTSPDFKCHHCGCVVNPKKNMSICLWCGNSIREELKYWMFTKEHEKLLKYYQETLKNINISIGKLQDKNEQLNQRIEKGKAIWEENKLLKEIIKSEVSEPYYTNIINKLTQNRKLAESNEQKPVGTLLPNPENNRMPKLPLPSNNPSSSRDEEQMDYTRPYAHVFREHGQFGSHPSHDDFGDESVP